MPANPGKDPDGPDTKSGKLLVLDNADSYAHFATAMYLDKWDWSDGTAQSPLMD